MLSHSRPRPAQALVEFALVLPLTIALSFGALQLVLYAHARDVVASAVQEGARLAAEDGRRLEEGRDRARSLIAVGLGSSLDPVALDGHMDGEVVSLRADAAMHPILPIALPGLLVIHAEATVTRERFRPGGG
jgi:hypothetical protein